jgi:hypothetical protein
MANCMQREQAHPASDVQDILMRMVPLDCDFVWNVVDDDDAVEQHQHDQDQDDQCDVI